MKIFSMAAVSAAAYGLMSSVAFASDCITNPTKPSCQATSVPEISALEGGAALAVLAAIVLLAWERRRRAA